MVCSTVPTVFGTSPRRPTNHAPSMRHIHPHSKLQGDTPWSRPWAIEPRPQSSRTRDAAAARQELVALPRTPRDSKRAPAELQLPSFTLALRRASEPNSRSGGTLSGGTWRTAQFLEIAGVRPLARTMQRRGVRVAASAPCAARRRFWRRDARAVLRLRADWEEGRRWDRTVRELRGHGAHSRAPVQSCRRRLLRGNLIGLLPQNARPITAGSPELDSSGDLDIRGSARNRGRKAAQLAGEFGGRERKVEGRDRASCNGELEGDRC